MSRARDIKVGLFVLSGIALTALVIFLIGDERRLFDSSVPFHTTFRDVQGLKAGAPIRMGGIDIGHVSSVGYGRDPSDPTIYVKLDVVRSEAGRIRTDSIVRLATKGLLGDKMVEITKGEAATVLAPGGKLQGEEPSDMMGKVGTMAAKAETALDKIGAATGGLADEGLQKDLRGSMASLHSVLSSLAQGEGYAHRLLADKDEAERLSRTLSNLEKATAELSATLTLAHEITRRVQEGPGFAHDLVYGDTGTQALAKVGDAAGELGKTLQGVREGKGLAKDVLFGEGEGPGKLASTAANVEAMTGDLRALVAEARAGRGTLGALLADPSVYEDLKTILGNVERNDILRALVRYSIKQGGEKPSVEVQSSPLPSPSPRP